MPAIVADTGPLNYLVLIDQIVILPALFETVSVPAAVRAEMTHPETPLPVRQWIASRPPWIVVRPDVEGADANLRQLGAGERSAIMLALTSTADLILMDDRAAVTIARRRGLVVTGTIGLLDLAARRGLLDLSNAFDRLRKTSFHVRPELLDAILARHRA